MPNTFHSKLFRASQRIYKALGTDISLGARIYITAFTIILIVFSSLFITFFHQQRIASLAKEIFLTRIQSMTAAQHLKDDLYSHNNSILQYVATDRPGFLTKSSQYAKSARIQLTAIKSATVNPVMRNQVGEFEKEMRAYLAATNALVRIAVESNRPKDAGIIKTWQWAKSQNETNVSLTHQSAQRMVLFQKLLSSCDDIVLYNRAKLADAHAQLESNLNQMVKTEIWVASITATFVLLLAVGLAASLLGSLRSLLTGIRHVEEGKFDMELPVRMTGELGALTMAFNRMSRAVRDHRRQLLHENITDHLTGAYNQRYFRKLLDREMDRARRSGRPVSLIMIDIDHFKLYNDSQGHELGNEVIKRVAEFIKENLRSVDLLSRYGGDEFVAILPGASTAEARDAARRLVQTIVHCRFPGDEILPKKHLTLSIGGATFPYQAKSSSDLLIKADDALYKVKKSGRHGFKWAEALEVIPASSKSLS